MNGKEPIKDSTRFRALIVAILVLVLAYGAEAAGVKVPHETIQELAGWVVGLVGTWIIGRSIRNTA